MNHQAIDGQGDTALHIATRNGNTKMVYKLLLKNLDFAQKNFKGKTALSISRDNDYDNITDLFKTKSIFKCLLDMKMSVEDQLSYKKAIFLFTFLCLDPFLAFFQLLPLMGVWHFVCVYMIPFFLTFFLFIYVSLGNPGFKGKRNGRQLLRLLDKKYKSITESDEAIPDSPLLSTICFVCNLEKKKARHCDICNRCVVKFDHHCPFLINCVGRKNFKVFLFFLLVSMIFLVGKFVFNILTRFGYLCWHDSTFLFPIFVECISLLRGRVNNHQIRLLYKLNIVFCWEF